MIVFNHSVRFDDLEDATCGDGNTRLDQIIVVRQADPNLTHHHENVSEWIPMSGRRARFTSPAGFSASSTHPHWSLEIDEVVTLTWEAGPDRIHYAPGPRFTAARLRFWTLHTMLPLALALAGRMDFLHAASVEVNGRPVVFTGESRAGKSTLASFFTERGHAFLADDSLGIRRAGNVFEAIASYPFRRPFRDPEELGYPVERMLQRPTPIHATYALEQSAPEATVEIHPLSGIERFKAYHFARFVRFAFLKQRQFQLTSELAATIPAFRVRIPWDMNRLADVYHAIVDHTRSIEPAD